MIRLKTREIFVGDVGIGGDNRISIQSMTNTYTGDSDKTINQINLLSEAGCDIIRVAVNDEKSSSKIAEIKKNIDIPIIADIHFDYKLAIKSIEGGIDCLRINPGNIGLEKNVVEVIKACREKNIPIRIGVNGGSLEKDILHKYGGVTSDGIIESALGHIRILEKYNYENLKVSLKSSNINLMVESYNKLSKIVDYPFHIGVTEAGTLNGGLVKSGVGIGILLNGGIGDTLRVSLTADPIHEVIAGKNILRALGLRNEGVEFISCPTCGRTEIDLIYLATEVERRLGYIKENIKIAVMGCPVNGPGEAREADLGIAGGKGQGLIFKRGEIIKKVKEEDLLDEFIKTVNEYLEEKNNESIKTIF